MGGYLFKTLMMGKPEQTITTMFQKYTTGQFATDPELTIGMEYAVHNVDIENELPVTLQLWQFSDKERFRTMLPSFCQGASGAMILFDLTEPQTFYELDGWINLVRRNTWDVPILLLGARYHLIESGTDIFIDPQQIKEFIQTQKINGYMSISVKSGRSVDEAFNMITKLMIKS